MVKQILPAIAVLIFLSSCSTFKPLNFTSNKQVVAASASKNSSARFIDDISVTPQSTTTKSDFRPGPQVPVSSHGANINESPVITESPNVANLLANRNKMNLESASNVQLKYSVLMNTEVENLPTKELLDGVDEWYGVRYRVGGNTKTGVD